ncbi:Myotubularin-related protein 12 [Clarias magur]|uniref:Myotubularin-related protein 12 n=1 Tax=Clarias magur TaxID=1594786 RepID=A0A8J4UR41_CLAMG|nr:Myotubularin-related protein 12 [Clarias magur]
MENLVKTGFLLFVLISSGSCATPEKKGLSYAMGLKTKSRLSIISLKAGYQSPRPSLLFPELLEHKEVVVNRKEARPPLPTHSVFAVASSVSCKRDECERGVPGRLVEIAAQHLD